VNNKIATVIKEEELNDQLSNFQDLMPNIVKTNTKTIKGMVENSKNASAKLLSAILLIEI
jgi:ribosomal protein L1